jgi:hypothetical protein
VLRRSAVGGCSAKGGDPHQVGTFLVRGMGTPRTGAPPSIARPPVPLHGPFVLPAPPIRSPDRAQRVPTRTALPR